MMSVTLIKAKHQDILQNIYTGLYQKIVDTSDISRIITIFSKKTVVRITQRFDIISDSTIHFLGNGIFHYLTLLLLKKYSRPFTLIIFDYHNDAGKEHGKEMIDSHKDLIEVISENELDYLTSLLNKHTIPTEDIYISLNRDILSETEVQTNWNQGTLLVEQLKRAIKLVF